jgi:hypothetical protein
MKTVIEPGAFLADVRASGMSDEEHTEIVAAIAANPDQGEIIRESGGARKFRVAGRGKGKSGGYRIVFYPAPPDVPALMLALINKASAPICQGQRQKHSERNSPDTSRITARQ